MEPVQHVDFVLERDFVELNQLLKLAGIVDSGGAGKHLVAEGIVRVNGLVELRKTCKIHEGQIVTVGDIEIKVWSKSDVNK
ncbi:RNA-binding protein [Sulfuriferula sp. AH1]|uniref:RNA-binding S4 domain-containing protein n=1 Tax=Sulfuriferula sp. AH1 TaxID=1985873 RepID=UPI000B3B2EED|nr:RNA-binding S4 domain-containing protein [Sulfuriferula sp. AH1]ARU31716.1 RNA-binding protein [Sulfuriferula sp. AH1]